MTENGYPQARHSRLGEVTLWSVAALLMLGVHAGFAYYLMQEPEEQEAGGPPPAAIMIEMAAIPEAVKTEETTPAQDVEDAEEVKSDSSEPVEEAAPEEPPPPEPVAETPPPPEPVQPPEPPVEEIVEPQEIPEPVEPVDPVQEQMMAELENIEVPLPVMRPPPPPVEKPIDWQWWAILAAAVLAFALLIQLAANLFGRLETRLSAALARKAQSEATAFRRVVEACRAHDPVQLEAALDGWSHKTGNVPLLPVALAVKVMVW